MCTSMILYRSTGIKINCEGFEKRGHFARVIFERMPVFKWLLVGQILLKLNENIIFDHSACCISHFRAMGPNLDEYKQVETCVSSKIICTK